MNKYLKWVSVALSGLMVALMLTRVVAAQDDLPPCAFDDGTIASCMFFHMTPDTLVGEVWFNGFQFVFGDTTTTNHVYDWEAVSGLKGVMEFRNIVDPTDPNFNVLYVYKDVSKNFTTPALGTWKVYELKPTKKYIRQEVELTCNIKSWVDENIACGLNIDGVDEPNPIPAGQKVSYALDPGPHTIIFTLVGDPAQTILWSPASLTKKMTAFASATVSKQTATFTKAGHLLAGMDQPGALADWYLDGNLIATQAATIDQWVVPSKTHKLEIKNIDDATIDGFLFHWKDASQSPSVGSGKEKTVTFKLVKEGNWAQPFEYTVPKDSLADGAHTYNMAGVCASDPTSPFTSDAVTFNVDSAAELVFPALYLRPGGVRTAKTGGENFLDSLSPKQVLKALTTLSSRDKPTAAAFATDCTMSITLDGVVIPLVPGTLYRLKP